MEIGHIKFHEINYTCWDAAKLFFNKIYMYYSLSFFKSQGTLSTISNGVKNGQGLTFVLGIKCFKARGTASFKVQASCSSGDQQRISLEARSCNGKLATTHSRLESQAVKYDESSIRVQSWLVVAFTNRGFKPESTSV